MQNHDAFYSTGKVIEPSFILCPLTLVMISVVSTHLLFQSDFKTHKILLITLLLFAVRNLLEGVRIQTSGLVLHFDAIEDRYSAVYSCEARVNDEEGEQVIRANFELRK